MELHNINKIKSHAASQRNNNQQLSAPRSQNTVEGLCLANPAAALLLKLTVWRRNMKEEGTHVIGHFQSSHATASVIDRPSYCVKPGNIGDTNSVFIISKMNVCRINCQHLYWWLLLDYFNDEEILKNDKSKDFLWVFRKQHTNCWHVTSKDVSKWTNEYQK